MFIDNPYAECKPYPYKASLHNHTRFSPSYTHAPVLAADRLREYRDYATNPPYGIVAITDHDRISTPWNTNPPCTEGVCEEEHDGPPWGVEGILWLPGMERILGQRDGSDQQLFGEVVCLNCDPKLLETTSKWLATPSPQERSGWYYRTKEVPASAELTFVGTGIEWIARTHSGACIARVLIDGQEVATADLYSEETCHRQVVFSCTGLPHGVHTIRIVHTDERNPNNTNRYAQEITLDAFVVRKADGSEVTYGANHPEIRYSPLRHRYDRREGEVARDVLAQLRQDGVYTILSHPNARLETEGNDAGKQIWSSAGYTYEELECIFGSKERALPSWPYLPNALEIGNYGYDLSGGVRTQWTNAEAKWDYLLSQGHRVHGVASDDSHGKARCGGWCVIYTNAPTSAALTIDDVMDSLFKGAFYASQGPAFRTIAVEGNDFVVETDVPATIEFISQGRVVHKEERALAGRYTLRGDEGYVRARLTREDPDWPTIDGPVGKRRSAWTNPIYVHP